MEVKEMQMQDIVTRSKELEEEIARGGVDIEALESEVEELEARKLEIESAKEERENEIKEAFKDSKELKSNEDLKEERQTMELKEFRNTNEYIHGYRMWVQSGYKNDKELRKVLSENGLAQAGENDTTYPVPEFVESKIRTAWENDQIMSRVTRTYFKGNVKVGFEISGTDAVIHLEGGSAIGEEKLVLGTVTLVPQSIKKMLKISDELYDLSDTAFLDYVYDELTYRIVKKAGAIVIASIIASPAVSSATAPAVNVLTQALGAGTIVSAEALLSDEADEVVAIMNRATWGELRALQLTSGANVGDVFDGKDVLFSSELPPYATASAGATYMIVGDLRAVQANFPNGDEVKFKFDDLSEAEADLIKIVGRMFAGIGVTEPNKLTQVKKAS